MDFPFLLLVLLALPVVIGAVIVMVSVGRRRGRPPAEPSHRLQSGTAAAQDAAEHPAAPAPPAASARLRRAESADRPHPH